MTQKFLKAKHWQLFLLTFGIPMTFQLLMMTGINEPGPGKIGGFLSILITLHLFSIFCIFHSLYFAAKAFKTAELQRRVTFSDFAGEFFMIWFYPIGIWIVQPKVNRMVGNEELTTTKVEKP